MRHRAASRRSREVAIMPKSDRTGRVKQSELPSTLRRSDAKAQRTFAKTHDSAAQTYGDERRAHQAAFAAVKHSYEKVGDHWEAKDQLGPSDARAAGGRDTDRPTAGGVDANASKQHLMDVARRLQIQGRSSMRKDELVEAIQRANDRASAAARDAD
jgi:cation transport regulator ChaB